MNEVLARTPQKDRRVVSIDMILSIFFGPEIPGQAAAGLGCLAKPI
jgi:hypothetical protein